jgi:hypothetical protein
MISRLLSQIEEIDQSSPQAFSFARLYPIYKEFVTKNDYKYSTLRVAWRNTVSPQPETKEEETTTTANTANDTSTHVDKVRKL